MYENQSSSVIRPNANGTSTETTTEESHSATNKNALMKLKSYLIALRVWSLSGSIIPTILGELRRWDEESSQGDMLCNKLVSYQRVQRLKSSDDDRWTFVLFFTPACVVN